MYKDSESEDGEQSELAEDEDAALSVLTEHDEEDQLQLQPFANWEFPCVATCIKFRVCSKPIYKVVSDSSVVTPPLYIPALSGKMQSLVVE